MKTPKPQVQMAPPAPVPEDPTVAKQKDQAYLEEQRRARGRASTILTSGAGATDKVATSASQLLAA